MVEERFRATAQAAGAASFVSKFRSTSPIAYDSIESQDEARTASDSADVMRVLTELKQS